MPPAKGTLSAAARVFATTELVEQILLALFDLCCLHRRIAAIKDVFTAMRVSKNWQSIIYESVALQRKLLLEHRETERQEVQAHDEKIQTEHSEEDEEYNYEQIPPPTNDIDGIFYLLEACLGNSSLHPALPCIQNQFVASDVKGVRRLFVVLELEQVYDKSDNDERDSEHKFEPGHDHDDDSDNMSISGDYSSDEDQIPPLVEGDEDGSGLGNEDESEAEAQGTNGVLEEIINQVLDEMFEEVTGGVAGAEIAHAHAGFAKSKSPRTAYLGCGGCACEDPSYSNVQHATQMFMQATLRKHFVPAASWRQMKLTAQPREIRISLEIADHELRVVGVVSIELDKNALLGDLYDALEHLYGKKQADLTEWLLNLNKMITKIHTAIELYTSDERDHEVVKEVRKLEADHQQLQECGRRLGKCHFCSAVHSNGRWHKKELRSLLGWE